MRELRWENTFEHTSHVCSFSVTDWDFGGVKEKLEMHIGPLAFSVSGKGRVEIWLVGGVRVEIELQNELMAFPVRGKGRVVICLGG